MYSTECSIVSFQKTDIISIFIRKLVIVLHEKLVILRVYFGRSYSFMNSQIPGMFALFTSVYKPDIDSVTVGIHSEFTRIHKFLFLSTSSAAVVNFNCRHFRPDIAHINPPFISGDSSELNYSLYFKPRLLS